MNTATAMIMMNPWLWVIVALFFGFLFGAWFGWLMNDSVKHEKEYYLNIRRDADEHAMDYEKEVKSD